MSFAFRIAGACAAAALLVGAAHSARADDAPAAPPEVKFSGYIDAGATFASRKSPSDITYGHLFTDKTNQLVLNQAVLTLSKDLDPKAEGYDFGFKLQGMFGTDARYTHFLGELDRTIKQRTQLDIVEANVLVHVPDIGAGGTDLKIGQYSTPLGEEVIDGPSNLLYSHSYIFNFGLPLKHTGALATIHATADLDLWAGVDSGTNTSLGKKGDNNGAPGGIVGLGINNLLDGKGTFLALVHLGPENPSLKAPGGIPDANKKMRYFGDALFTYKASDTLTFITEVNYIKDDAFNVKGYGAAQYVSYAADPEFTITGRVDVWRDSQGFFVAAFPGNRDFDALQRGLPLEKSLIATAVPTTYGEVTLGVTYKPAALQVGDGFMIRPEVRYDRTMNKVLAYDDLTKRDQFTFGIDAILQFSM
jgi:hypothetical protein